MFAESLLHAAIGMLMRDIPREEWDTFLNTFNRQHQDEPVTLEKSDMRDGLRLAARSAPLVAITHDRAAQLISITVAESPSGQVTHTVTQPEAIAIEEPAEADEDPHVSVHLMGGGQHFVMRLSNQVH